MTSFVHTEYATEHPGVVRAEQAVASIRYALDQFSGSRATASVLLAAVVSALVVTANQVIDTWTDGHLMAAWIVLWTVAFTASALLTSPLRVAVNSLRAAGARWAAARRAAAADEKLWKLALTDARVMSEISRAMSSDVLDDVRAYR